MDENKQITVPKWVEIWLAGIVTYLIVGQSLDSFASAFNEQAKDLVQYGLGVVTGMYIQLKR
ncbi:MAG: hypothetical protein ACOY46_19645 [Bacillota bacterium]